MSTPLRTPGSARTRALGFTHDSDSDDDFSPGASSAARRASVRFGYPSAGVSSASRIRSRELAAARNFREASREKATLKQHCDALEDKVKALEQSLSETVEVATARKERKETESSERDEALAAAASRAAAAEAELAELRAELALATENHEWLRRALEARTAANATAETERQALSARVVELERILDESEAHLSALQVEREAHKMKYKKRAAAATAQRLAAEATAAMLKGEMARMRAQMDKKEKEKESSPVLEGLGVLEDVTNCAALGTSERVAGGEDASTEALLRCGSPGARVSLAPSAMASPSCAKDDKDDSAMGRVGPADDGSETVSKPARKRDLALSSPAAAMEFERAPETTRLAANVARLATKTSRAISPTKGFFAGTELSSHVGSVAMVSARLFARLASSVMRDAADARRGVRVTPRTASANLFLACLVAACVFVAMTLSSALAFESLGLGLTYGVRMGDVPPQKGFGAGYAFGFFSFLNELRNGLRRLGGVAAV
jgi:putative Mn2+ efflux pump MntP